MSETFAEQPSQNLEIFPDDYAWEVIDRLRLVKWGPSKETTTIHVPYQPARLHADIIDSATGKQYHFSTHPKFLDLPDGLPAYMIPGYGFKWGGTWLPNPLVSVTNREKENLTHVLMPNFENIYYFAYGYGLKHGFWPLNPNAAPSAKEQIEFRILFEHLAPLE
jgi:hypothetical protein